MTGAVPSAQEKKRRKPSSRKSRGFDLKPDWIIFGGESGPRRRPVDAAWAETIQRECKEFGAAFFMKQMSAFTPAQAKGLIPAHLLIQEFPGVRITF